MKTVILAGGLGTRISEESHLRPKPMIEVGGRPILWHIMKLYSHYGFNDFVVCLGYKGSYVKRYFLDYFEHSSDITVDLASNTVAFHRRPHESWRVTLVETGPETQTGGRLKRIEPYLDNETFLMTYGDAVTNLDIREVVALHRRRKALATVTAVRPLGRFGAISIDDDKVVGFEEKPIGDGGWINGGFFVLERGALAHIAGDDSIWEHEPMAALTRRGELAAYQFTGFWQCMDTLRDKRVLESLWASPSPPWRVWKD